jgi:hypothetical protein
MFRIAGWNRVWVASLGMALLLSGPASAQEFKGQIKIGTHKVRLEQGKLYQIKIDAPGESPPFVTLDFTQGVITNVMGKEIKDDRLYFIPKKTDNYTFYVMPGFGPPKDGVIDYTLSFKGLSFADKAVLEEKSKLTDKDPKYKLPPNDFGPMNAYKAYKVQMKANQTYVIDMVRSDNSVDPYLYLEGPDGKIVMRDDDSGGDLNARIIYRPQQDGEFRIIATNLRDTTGEFTLTVKAAKE